MAQKSARSGSGSFRMHNKHAFLQRRGCLLYLYSLVTSALGILIGMSASLLFCIDTVQMTLRVLYCVQVVALNSQFIIGFLFIFTRCKSRGFLLSSLLCVVNYLTLLPILIYQFVSPLNCSSESPTFHALSECMNEETDVSYQIALALYGFSVLISIISCLGVLLLITLLLLYKLQSVYPQRKYSQRLNKIKGVNWIIESGPQEQHSDYSEVKNISSPEEGNTGAQNKRQQWQRKMTLDRKIHDKLIKESLYKVVKSKTFMLNSMKSIKTEDRQVSKAHKASSSLADFLHSNTVREIQLTTCDLCHQPLKDQALHKCNKHSFHENCYDEWERNHLLETGNLPPACPFCK